jgi:hypothetical protein
MPRKEYYFIVAPIGAGRKRATTVSGITDVEAYKRQMKANRYYIYEYGTLKYNWRDLPHSTDDMAYVDV